MPRTNSKNQGAGDTRDQIREMNDRLLAKLTKAAETEQTGFQARTITFWLGKYHTALNRTIARMPARAAKKPGGLGKK